MATLSLSADDVVIIMGDFGPQRMTRQEAESYRERLERDRERIERERIAAVENRATMALINEKVRIGLEADVASGMQRRVNAG